MIEETRKEIVALLERKKKKYLLLSDIQKGFSVGIKKALNISGNPSVAEILKRVKPALGPDLLDYKKGRSIYIGSSLRDIVTDILQKKPGKSVKQIQRIKLPVTNEFFLTELNRLIKEGVIECRFNRHSTPCLFPGESKEEAHNDLETFRQAHDRLSRGGSFVRIYKLRRELKWDRERFDQALSRLKKSLLIQLQGGNPSVLTEDEISDSYTDEKGRLRLTITGRWDK